MCLGRGVLPENRLNKLLRGRAERALFAARTGHNGVCNVLGYIARPSVQLFTIKDECHVLQLLCRNSLHIYVTLHLKDVYATDWEGVCDLRRKEILLRS